MTRYEMWAILQDIKYKNWRLALGTADDALYLQWQFIAPDYTDDGQSLKDWSARKHILSKHMTESELVQTAFFAAQQAEEHECREAFSYGGKHVFNPHISISALMSVCDDLEVRA